VDALRIEVTNKVKSKKKIDGPDLSKYLGDNAKRYVTYRQAAMIYSIPYYAFVKMAKEANSCWKIRKTVIVDLDKSDAYLETMKVQKE
jgi:hypothetical protein